MDQPVASFDEPRCPHKNRTIIYAIGSTPRVSAAPRIPASVVEHENRRLARPRRAHAVPRHRGPRSVHSGIRGSRPPDARSAVARGRDRAVPRERLGRHAPRFERATARRHERGLAWRERVRAQVAGNEVVRAAAALEDHGRVPVARGPARARGRSAAVRGLRRDRHGHARRERAALDVDADRPAVGSVDGFRGWARERPRDRNAARGRDDGKYK